MKNTILVLTNSEDGIHSEVVISKLLQQGAKVFRFDSDRFSSGQYALSFSASIHNIDFMVEHDGETLRSEDINSVWYRRPNRLKFSIQDTVQKNYAESELRSFLDGLWAILEERGIFWLSKPSALERGRKKLLQLELARKKGMPIPRTIISNSPAEILEFYRGCQEKMIFKAIYHEYLDYGECAYNIPTTLITKSHLAKLELVKRVPTLFQEYIEKEYEMRITVVGNTVFPVKIDSQGNPLTIVDWRNPLCINKLSYTQIEIDQRLATFCLEMLRDMDLQFGAFDFAVDKKGNIFFLEVNANGQWYWLEEYAGVLISDAIVDIMKSERR